MATNSGKATLLWPGLPHNPGLDRAYQAFPGHAFLATPAKTLASLAWLGLAGLAMLLTALLMKGKGLRINDVDLCVKVLEMYIYKN